MASLSEQLGAGSKREAVIDDALKVLDEEVADKGGLSGMAIKGAYKLVQGVRPGFLRQVVNSLLGDFLLALDPVYQEAKSKGRPAGAYLQENSGRVADALLVVTDRKAQRADSAVVKGAYDKLRPMAKKQVEAAAPRLARLLEKHAEPTA
ncbi:MAG TPA: hypothetical protein VFQ61_34610 [Polyangiaceae bacterium]|nr:hypothetical protein [Polyangiaceae bacterium]